MADTNFTGEWFLPGNEYKAPGRILINSKKKTIYLQLYGQYSIEGEDVTKGLDSHPAHFHELIVGNGRFFSQVTLYKCFLRKVKELGKGLYQIVYEADFMFTGVHVANANEMLIRSGTFIFPYLSSWYDGWKSIDKLNGGRSGVYFSTDKELERELNRPKQAKPEHVEVNDNLTLVFFEKLEKQLKEVGVHYEVKFQKYLAFTYKKPVSFTQLLSDAKTFGKLLSFSISEPLNYNLLSVTLPETFITQQDLEYFHGRDDVFVTSFELSKGEKVDQHSMHQNWMIVSNWTFEKKVLNKIIVQWYKNSHLSHVYDYYNDSNNWFKGSEVILSNVMFNNRFLNIIQGLENYYKKTIKDERPEVDTFNKRKNEILSLVGNEELRAWLVKHLKPPRNLGLKGQLSSLISRFQKIINELFSNKEIIQLFPGEATSLRHKLSHGDMNQTGQGIALELYFYFGRVLLAICILESLGIDEIARRIEAYYRLNDKIHMLNNIKLIIERKTARTNS